MRRRATRSRACRPRWRTRVGCWQIENGLHYVKDVTLGEDRSLIHKGNGPSVMAILRDTVVSVLHRAGWRTIAERPRYYSGDCTRRAEIAWHPYRAERISPGTAPRGVVAAPEGVCYTRGA